MKASRSTALMGVVAALLAVAVLVAPEMAFAGSEGSELETIYNSLINWTQGYLGKLITLLFILVGLVAGVVRQSLMAFAVGIGAGIGIYNAPAVVNAVVGALI